MRLRRYWLALLLVALALIFSAATYHRLPANMAVHWGLDGNVDGWMSRPWGAWLLPLVSLLLTLLMIAAPVLRHRDGAATEPRIYPTLVATIAGFTLFLHAILLLHAMGSPLGVPRLVGAATGVLLAIVGNYMGKVPRNPWIGIRLPWTLQSDEVWERTHRFAAPVLVAGGLVLFVVCLARPDMRSPLPIVVILGVTAAIPVVKSYLIWRSVRRV